MRIRLYCGLVSIGKTESSLPSYVGPIVAGLVLCRLLPLSSLLMHRSSIAKGQEIAHDGPNPCELFQLRLVLGDGSPKLRLNFLRGSHQVLGLDIVVLQTRERRHQVVGIRNRHACDSQALVLQDLRQGVQGLAHHGLLATRV